MKKLIILLLLCLIGCSSNKPSAVVERFFDLKKSGKTERAMQYFSERWVKEVGREKLISEASGSELLPESLTIKEESIAGDVAEVMGLHTRQPIYDLGDRPPLDRQTYTFKLIKENGSWKIDDIKKESLVDKEK